MNSKYQETMDDFNRICPYCGYEYQVESEDYTEDAHEEECEDCGKKYLSYEVFSVSHYAEPDCELNGIKHKWVTVELETRRRDFCSVCDKLRKV